MVALKSKLVKHAETELALIGEDPAFTQALLEMVRIFSEMGHYGASAFFTIEMLAKLLNFKNLAPLTNNPEEWHQYDMMWQNRRNPEAFSYDGGLTYFLNSQGGRATGFQHTAVPAKEGTQ